MKTQIFCIRIFFIIISSLLLLNCAHYQPQIIAHRGASFLAPENTVSAVTKAWELGADGAEIDVHLSKDNRIMVNHDSSTTRTSGEGHIIARTDSSVLRTLDVGTYKGPQYAGERIPFLEEVLEVIPNGKELYIEIKCGQEIVPILNKTLANYPRRDQMVIIGFNFDTMAKAKELMPDIPVYWLHGSYSMEARRLYLPHKPEWLDEAAAKGIDGLDASSRGVDKAFMDEVKKRNQALYVWTVNDMNEAAGLAALGVAGITTDRPGAMKIELKKRNKRKLKWF